MQLTRRHDPLDIDIAPPDLNAYEVNDHEIVEKLNKEINAILVDPKMRSRLAEFGATASSGSPAEFGKFIAGETEKWAKVVRATGAGRTDPRRLVWAKTEASRPFRAYRNRCSIMPELPKARRRDS